MRTRMTKRLKCDCSSCQSACTFKPGWLKFGDEKIIAKKTGLTINQLFKKYLLVDWWYDGEKDYFGLSPCVTRLAPGGMFPYDPRGKCVFFKDGLCSIHKVAPTECQTYYHTFTHEEVISNHKNVAQSWDNPKAKALIKELLGYEPQPIKAESWLDNLSLIM